MRRSYLLMPFVLVFFFCITIVQAEDPSFSTASEQYLFFDQNFNVVQRLRTEEKRRENLLSEEEKLPVPINIYQADLKSLSEQVFLSRFMEPSDAKKILTLDGKLMIPVLESDGLMNLLLRTRFGLPIYQTNGKKTLSRATYFIDPVGPTGGYFAKFAPHVPGVDEKLKREVLINDFIKTQLDQLPPDMRNLMMDSYASVNFSFLGVPFSLVYRSANRILDHDPGSLVYPGHGLLGCEDCVRSYAMKWSGLADPEKAIALWKQEEYLPKLARYLAYAHHVLGVSFEAHTQNIVLELNHQTGQIRNFFFRDFADILLNPIPLLSENRFPEKIDWQRVKLISIHPHYFSDPSVQMAKDIWYHVSIYAGQAITSHLTGFQRQQRHLLTFLKAYISETEKILGQSVPLSTDALKVIDSLESRSDREAFYAGELKERSPLRNAMASVLKPLFEFSQKSKIDQIQLELEQSIQEKDAAKLSRAFFKAMSVQRVIFMGPDERERIYGQDTKTSWLRSTVQAFFGLGLARSGTANDMDFKIYQNRIWAIDKITQRPIAATVDGYEERGGWLKKITSFFHTVSGKGLRCSEIFRRSQ